MQHNEKITDGNKGISILALFFDVIFDQNNVVVRHETDPVDVKRDHLQSYEKWSLFSVPSTKDDKCADQSDEYEYWEKSEHNNDLPLRETLNLRFLIVFTDSHNILIL